jgi:RNA polymerase sigma-70 factor (ECF subfamily)
MSKGFRTLDAARRADLEASYREAGADLWRSVYAYTGGIREIADDAVAEAFAQAGRRMHEIRDLRAWICRAAFRIAAGELQRRRAANDGFDSLLPAPISAEEPVRDLIDLLRTLSPNQRGALILRDLYGYPSKEAGRILGVSEVAIRVHLHAARRRLRGLLEEVERT